ncbi:MAG: lipocalin-like domain-containing protein [Paraprevotella sp.]|nr:lipocalin-like domain-containing protein [Paraprevotella sp.]
MKRITYICLTAFLSVLLYTTVSCDKLPKNGDLEGNWQLTEITTYQEDNQPITEDVKYKKIFWNFQLDLLCIHFYNESYKPKDKDGTGYNEFFARFNHQGSSLSLPQIYVHDSRSTDRPIEEMEPKDDIPLLQATGIITPQASFTIETLDKERMVLTNGNTRLVFRKF